MPIKYRIDILEALKVAGYSTYKLRKEKLLGEATIQRLRVGAPVSWEKYVCSMPPVNCQPGDILEYVPDSEEKATSE